MLTKEKVLTNLDEIMELEEGMVTLLANFSLALVKITEGIAEEKIVKIHESLSQLHNECALHREIIFGLIEQVKGSPKNEY